MSFACSWLLCHVRHVTYDCSEVVGLCTEGTRGYDMLISKKGAILFLAKWRRESGEGMKGSESPK